MRTNPRLVGATAGALAFAPAQISKYWMIQGFDIASRQPIRLAPFLDVVLAWNPGVSYSMLPAGGPLGRWALLALAAAAVGVLGVWLWRTHDRLTATALGLAVGGGG